MLKAAKSPLLKNRSRYDGQLLSYVILLRFGSLVTPDFSKPTRFGEKKISPSTIRRIYLKHKIRFKNIKRGKREIDFTEPHYR
jgi:hypothetical protein